jgi:hypothetical protein
VFPLLLTPPCAASRSLPLTLCTFQSLQMLVRLLRLTALAVVLGMVSADCPDAQFVCSRPLSGATDHVSFRCLKKITNGIIWSGLQREYSVKSDSKGCPRR